MRTQMDNSCTTHDGSFPNAACGQRELSQLREGCSSTEPLFQSPFLSHFFLACFRAVRPLSKRVISYLHPFLNLTTLTASTCRRNAIGFFVFSYMLLWSPQYPYSDVKVRQIFQRSTLRKSRLLYTSLIAFKPMMLHLRVQTLS